MGCNCKWVEVIIAAVILVVTIWPSIIGDTASYWVIIIGAALLLIHALTCRHCGMCKTCGPEKSSSKGKKKRKK